MQGQPLRGREAELAELGRLTDATRADGELRVALVTGEAGIGKSHLVDVFARQVLADDGQALLLRGECLDLGSATLPYAPIVQALRPVLRAPETVGLALDEPTRAGLARLLPELGDAAGHPASLPDVEVGHTQLYEHVLGVVERLAAARGLLVLVVEDVHFGEQATRDMLQFLVGNLLAAPVLILLTVRDDEIGRRHPARPFLQALERSPRVTRVPLGRLDRVAMSEVLWGVLPPGRCAQSFVDEILDRAEGNPFHAVELARTPEHLPAHLSDLLLDAVERCEPTTQEVLRALAAARQPIGHETLLRITGLSEGQLTTALREAVEARLVAVDDDGGHRLRHALLQEAVEDTLLPGEAKGLHAALAAVLAEQGGTAGCHAARLARHYLAARDRGRALESAIAAGEQALEVVAYAEARAHFEMAAELWPEVPDAAVRTGVDLADVLTKAALSAISGHEDRRGIGLAEQALAHLDPATDPERTGLVWMWIGHGHRTDWPAAEAALRRAVEIVPQADTQARARVEAALAVGLLLQHRLDEAEVETRRAIEVARRAGSTRDEVYGLITLASVRAGLGDADVDGPFDEARRRAESIDRVDYRLRCDINHSSALVRLGRYVEGIAVAESGEALARAHGLDRSYGTMLRTNAVWGLLGMGRLDDAWSLAGPNAITAPDGLLGGEALMVVGHVLLARGEVERAARKAASAARHLGPEPEPQFRLPLRQLQADVALAEGDHVAATRIAREGLDLAVALPGIADAAAGLGVTAVEALRGAGADTAEVAEVRRLVDAAAGAGETPVHAAARAMLHALVTSDGGDPGDAERWLVAAGRHAEVSMALGQSRCLAGAAEVLLAAGDRAGAVECWKAALELADGAGATRLQHQVEQLGRRAGFLAEAAATDGYGLTPREHEVLRLLAQGLSNAEIGEALFISAKTASVHVSNILAKLEVPTRQHAAATAHRVGLIG